MGRSTHTLDVMSDGQLLRDLSSQLDAPLDSGLSIGLKDVRSADLQGQDLARNLDVLEADVIRKGTWRKVDDWMKGQNIQGFDYVFGTPFGGMIYLPQGPEMAFYLIGQLYERLACDDGRMLIQASRFYRRRGDVWGLPPEYHELVTRDGFYPVEAEVIKAWVEHAKQQGVDVDWGYDSEDQMNLILQIIRHVEGPDSLPPLPPASP